MEREPKNELTDEPEGSDAQELHDQDDEIDDISLAVLQRRSDVNSVEYNERKFINVFPICKESIDDRKWLVVAFPTMKKRKFKYFIGKVTNINDDKNEFEGSFLRYRNTKQFAGYMYGFPDVLDICEFKYDQIVEEIVLVNPTSRRDLLHFPIKHTDLE